MACAAPDSTASTPLCTTSAGRSRSSVSCQRHRRGGGAERRGVEAWPSPQQLLLLPAELPSHLGHRDVVGRDDVRVVHVAHAEGGMQRRGRRHDCGADGSWVLLERASSLVLLPPQLPLSLLLDLLLVLLLLPRR